MQKRVLWLEWQFNIGVHGATGKSYMLNFLEGRAKKGASSVCSILWHIIQREFISQSTKETILFSDACGGQSRNYTVFSVSAALARTFRVAHFSRYGTFLLRVRRERQFDCTENGKVGEHSIPEVLREPHSLIPHPALRHSGYFKTGGFVLILNRCWRKVRPKKKS